jgi:hypothetical protein
MHDVGNCRWFDLSELELEPLDDQLDLVAQMDTRPHVLRRHD